MKYIKEKWQQISPIVWGGLQFVLWILVAISAIAFASVVFDYATKSIADALGTGSPAGITDKRGTLEFIGLIMGGLLAAIGAIALHRRAEAQTKSADAQANTAKEQAENNRLTEKGHIQDRFKTAIEHLGSERAGMKIAAYYEFYQLAQDNKDDRNFCRKIFEILCAHLRQITTAFDYKGKTKPTEGVQTLLDLLFITEDSKTIFRGLKANLQRVRLVGADLRNAHIPQADFSDACLIDADMRFAQLHKCRFIRAKMHNSILICAQMVMAEFHETQLLGAYLFNANFQQSYMVNVNCCGSAIGYSPAFSSFGTQMQNAGHHWRLAKCHTAHMGGVCPKWNGDFASTISAQAGKDGNIEDAVFSGGGKELFEDQINETTQFLKEYVTEKSAKQYQKDMQRHINQPPMSLQDTDTFAGKIVLNAYSEEDAARWITEYKKAIGEIHGDGK